MTSKLYAPSIPLTPEPLRSVRTKRLADRRRLAFALAVRSPFVIGGYLFLAFALPYLTGGTPSRAYLGVAVLGLLTLWRGYLYLDAQIASNAFSTYDTLDGLDIEECHLLLSRIPEGAAFRSAVLAQGRFFTRHELTLIRQRAQFLGAPALDKTQFHEVSSSNRWPGMLEGRR
jgi:hypothetical protein